MDLDPVIETEPLEHGADDRMLDRPVVPDVLDLRPDNPGFVLEERRQIATIDVAEAVDRGGEHRAAILAEPGRVVSAATKEGHAIGRAADDHGVSCTSPQRVSIDWPRRVTMPRQS